jgi:hypothetical protein
MKTLKLAYEIRIESRDDAERVISEIEGETGMLPAGLEYDGKGYAYPCELTFIE